MSESNDFTNLVITEDKLFISGDNVSVTIWHYEGQNGKADAKSIKLEAKISQNFLNFLAAEKEKTNKAYVTYKNLDAVIKEYLDKRHKVTDPVLIVIQHPGHEPYLLVEENRLVLPSASSPTGSETNGSETSGSETTSSARTSAVPSSLALSSSEPCPAGKVRVQDGFGGSECLPKD